LSTGPPCLSAAERLERLHRTLEGLASQFREGIARAVALAVAESVQQTLRGLLGESEQPIQRSFRPSGWREPMPSSWMEEGEEEDNADPWLAARPALPAPAPAPPPRSDRWASALAAGIKAGVCWLRGRPRLAVLGTLTAGCVTFLLVLTVPTKGVLGLLASTFGALALADVTHLGAGVLARAFAS
jgi:hypothetical protein